MLVRQGSSEEPDMGDDFIDSIRLSQHQRNELLRSIDRKTQHVADSKRKHDRIDCPLTNIRLIVHHPDGEIARFIVCTRNISAGGLAFLHGGFLYPGCRCEITLPTVWGGKETLTGHVVTCRHIEKQIHEFGLAVNNLIDRRRFVTLPGERALKSEPDTLKVAALAGRVLIVDACKINADLAQHHIKSSSVVIESAESIKEGLVMIRSIPIDAVLLDIDDPDPTPEEKLLLFREAGYKGPIICTSTSPDSNRSRAALAAGADEIIGRPITASSLVRILTECLSGCDGVFGPVHCQLESSPDTVELIENYLSFISSLSTSLTKGIEEEDLANVLKDCRSISLSAGGYGFPSLEQAANDAETAINESKSITESLQELQRLRSVCSRLEPISIE